MLSFKEFILQEANVIYKSLDGSEKLIQGKLRTPKINVPLHKSRASAPIETYKIRKPRIKAPTSYK